jgi:hypothetical protein
MLVKSNAKTKQKAKYTAQKLKKSEKVQNIR